MQVNDAVVIVKYAGYNHPSLQPGKTGKIMKIDVVRGGLPLYMVCMDDGHTTPDAEDWNFYGNEIALVSSEVE